MAIVWNWQDFWNWFDCIESPQNKLIILKQIDAQFVRGLSYERQVEMFKYAPIEITTNIGHLLCPEAFEILNPNKKLRRK